MAKRRMISVDVMEQDNFLELPEHCQVFYIHLHLMADDDGFIGNPKALLRMYGYDAEVLDTLISKGFIIQFGSGIIVIRHWPLENRVKRDRYTPTVHQKEFQMLSVDDNKVYNLQANL